MPRKPKAPGTPPDWGSFPGFDAPHYTQTPDDIFDWVMADLTGAELKCLLYIVRRTFGWKKDCDAISVEQMTAGIVKRDGTRQDKGTGLARTTALEALRSLEESKRLIVGERRVDDKGGSLPTVYSLRMKGGTLGRTPPVGSSVPPAGTVERTPGVRKSVPTRDSDPRNNPINSRYTRGKYGMCPLCGGRPCLPHCSRASV